MRVGDLVELQSRIHHTSGVYSPGIFGIIAMIDKHVHVIFGGKLVGCHRRELGVICEIK